MQALESITIVELTDTIAPAYCARQAALWGATVTTDAGCWKNSIYCHPTISHQGQQHSLLQYYLHQGKQFVHRVTSEMIEQADVLVTDRSSAQLKSLYPQVKSWPIVVDFSPYGRSGPYADYAASELTIEAMSGFLSINGYANEAPLRMPAHLIGYICGVSGFISALGAIHQKQQFGTISRVEVSCMEALATIVPTLRTQLEGEFETRQGGPGGRTLGVRLYNVGGDYLSTNFALPSALEVHLDIVGLGESSIPEHLDTVEKRKNYAALAEFVESVESPFTVADLFKILSEQPYRTVVGKVQGPTQLLRDPQLASRGFFHQVVHKGLGKIRFPGPPANMSKTPAQLDNSTERSRQAKVNHASSSNNDPSDFPLAGVLVLDLTQAWIGPYAAQLLLDMGAEVIKIESHNKPDVWRMMPPEFPKNLKNPDALLVNTSCNFNCVNRGKKSLTLDLSQPRGKALFLQLVKDADIVMENFTPGVMKRFGLAYDDLIKVNPGLVMASYSGYGNSGPYADYRATGTTIEATAGWDSLFGNADGPPMVMGFYQADAITGLQMAATTLAALHYRNVTGEGQHVEGSMFEAAVGYIGEELLNAACGGETQRFGNSHPDMAPHGVYPSAGEDEWVAIAVATDTDFVNFCEVAEMVLVNLVTFAERKQNQDLLDQHIADWTRGKSAIEVTRLLQSRGIAAAPVQRTDQVLKDTHLKARDWFQELLHPDLGSLLYDGSPWRFSSEPFKTASASPQLGEHSRMILRERLRLSETEIDQLVQEGVTGVWTPGVGTPQIFKHK